MNSRFFSWIVAALLICGLDSRAEDVKNSRLILRPIGHEGTWLGVDLVDRASGTVIAPLRISLHDAIYADRMIAEQKDENGVLIQRLRFVNLRCRQGVGVTMGDNDSITIQLNGEDPYPRVDFDLTVSNFTPSEWERFHGGPCPFSFLVLTMPEAELWHQRGWLMATPKSDPFVLQKDVAFGGGSVASEFSRNWSYVCALGGSPMPVIGLWAPSKKKYLGFEFQGTRLTDNTERNICTAYSWQKEDNQQLITLCFPCDPTSYRKLAYPARRAKLASHGTLVWNLDLADTADPNRWLQQLFTERYGAVSPRVPHTPNVGYMPGATRLKDWPHLGAPRLISRQKEEGKFKVAGTVTVEGWNWYAESPVEAAYSRYDAKGFAALKEDLDYLLSHAKKFEAGGETCVYWEKPIEGGWTPEWGGEPVRSLHNVNGFAVGEAMIDIWRHEHESNASETARLLPCIDGIYNWARHFVWSRNEFPDVPASPFAIGGTLPAVFLLDYHFTFRNDPDRADRAKAALDLALSIVYRYLAAWPSDNDLFDNDDPSFLLEPNSGANWAGAPCANEVAWLIDVMAQVYVHTGDARLGYMLRGALDRWHLLYQDSEKPSLADYDQKAFTEGWGVYPGSGPGDGRRYDYGWADPLIYAWPIGDSLARVVCGERAVLACTKTGERFDVTEYRNGAASPAAGADFAFRVSTAHPAAFDIALSYPQVNLSGKRVMVRRGDQTLEWTDVTRPPQAPASLYIRNLLSGDQVIVGTPKLDGPVLEMAHLFEQSPAVEQPGALPQGGQVRGESKPRFVTIPAAGGDKGTFESMPLDFDTAIEMDWAKPASFAGWPAGIRWAYGVPLQLADPRSAPGGKVALSASLKLSQPIKGPATIFLAYVPTQKDASFSVLSEDGISFVASSDPVQVWQGWPPLFKQRILMVPINVPVQRTLETINFRNAMLAAVTVYRNELKSLPTTMAALSAGADEWRGALKDEAEYASIRQELAALPAGRVAILPTSPGGAAERFAVKCGLMEKSDLLTPQQMVEPGRLLASRYPVLLNLGGENYPFTVAAKGDGREALVNYLRSGGLIICLGTQPYPFFYGDSLPGSKPSPEDHPAPLLPELGLPMRMSFEKPPENCPLRLESALSQRILGSLPWQMPFPLTGDLRLRALDDGREETTIQNVSAKASPAPEASLPPRIMLNKQLVRYTSIYSVKDDRKRYYGDAVGYAQWVEGEAKGGHLLYVWSGLLQDPATAMPLLQSAFRFAIDQVKKSATATAGR